MRRLLLLAEALLPSFLRVRLLRARGCQIASGARISPLTVIDVARIELADGASIGPLCVIRARELRLGKRASLSGLSYVLTGKLSLGDDSTIAKLVVVSGPDSPHSSLMVGNRCTVFPYCWIDTTREVSLDDEVGVGGASYIFTHGSWQPEIDGFPVAFGPVAIGRNVWLPWRVFILPNVSIGDYATIGAGSIVNKSVPAYALAAGMPARILKERGQHRQSLSAAEQQKVVATALREAEENLRYRGHATRLTENSSGLELDVDGRKALFTSAVDPATPGLALVLAWERLGDAEIASLEASRAEWLDFGRRRRSLGSGALFDAVVAALSMRGIRLEPTERGLAASLPDAPRACLPGEEP